MKVIRACDQLVMPWKNGGGITREIAKRVDSRGNMVWRASRATISQDGDFSLFPGVERHLLLLKGEGFRLEFIDS